MSWAPSLSSGLSVGEITSPQLANSNGAPACPLPCPRAPTWTIEGRSLGTKAQNHHPEPSASEKLPRGAPRHHCSAYRRSFRFP